MRYNTDFLVQYNTEDAVPVRDIIESLRGVETVLTEVGRLLPQLFDGLDVDSFEIKVREIAQESPLRELILFTLIVTFQEDLKSGVTDIAGNTGYQIPDNMQGLVTVVALIIVFYGVGAIKDMVTGPAMDGPARRQLNGLIEEISRDTGKSINEIRRTLQKRYGEPAMLKRVANAASRFFTPSKRTGSAPVDVNDRHIDRATVEDIPAPYLLEHEQEIKPTRNFYDVDLELHAQDKDNAGRGWAAVIEGITDKRVKLKLMEDIDPSSLWNKDRVKGDVTVKYERVGTKLNAVEIQLHQILGDAM